MDAIKVYICDPNKNTGCAKTECQKECMLTIHREYSLTESSGALYRREDYLSVNTDNTIRNNRQFYQSALFKEINKYYHDTNRTPIKCDICNK